MQIRDRSNGYPSEHLPVPSPPKLRLSPQYGVLSPAKMAGAHQKRVGHALFEQAGGYSRRYYLAVMNTPTLTLCFSFRSVDGEAPLLLKKN
jgi:hypothetical protein